jgi:hypothetical protein
MAKELKYMTVAEAKASGQTEAYNKLVSGETPFNSNTQNKGITVKKGDTLNSIAQANGYKNYKDAGYTAPSGNPDLIRPGELIYSTNSERAVTADYNNQFNDFQSRLDAWNKEQKNKEIADKATADAKDIKGTDTKETKVTKTDEQIEIDNATKESENQMKSLTTQLDQVAYMMDSASNAMINSIKETYGGMITEMRDSNSRLLEGRKQEELRSGRARYVQGVSQGILTNEELEGTGRIATLNGKMLGLIAEVEQARAENMMSVFKQKWEMLKDTKKELTDTISGIHKAVTDRITADTNKLKEERATQTAIDKAAFDKSKRVAPALADSLDKFSTNEQKIAFINQYAKSADLEGYEDILLGDIYEASADNTKRQLDIKNIQSQINSRSLADQRANDKANEIGTPAEQSKVNAYLAENGTDEDIKKAQTDKTFFYWILNQAGE